MNRRQFLITGGAALMAAPAQSQPLPDPVQALVTRLRADGFTRIRIKRTWLGRVQIRARKGDIRREIVINPVTGEVLRDFQEEYDDDSLFDFFDRDDDFDGVEYEDDDDDDDDD